MTPDAPVPQWVVGDSRYKMRALEPKSFDFLFTCPPYYDLEVYSDNPADLSAMPSYETFMAAYSDIIFDASVALKPDRYAAIVVSEVRDKTGRYRGLVPDTIEAMSDAQLAYYNDVVIEQPVGSLAVRASRQFSAFRKIGRRHQNLIVGLKGDAEHGWSAEREWTPDPQTELWSER